MSREPILVFDIETVPDVETGRRILGLDGLDDATVLEAMASLRLQTRASDFQPAHLHRIVAISVALRAKDDFRVWSLGETGSTEAELVSWNGSGFDLPVLHYRALKHGIVATRYWDTGQFERDAKWDNYLGRYQFRHTDVMDVLALYQGRNNAPLHEIAMLLGLPGKLGMDGSQVAAAFQAGRIAEIRAYCETDVLNTYLVYLRFLLTRGLLDRREYGDEVAKARQFLGQSGAAHWQEFLDAWRV